jgi:hypothetical protein
MGNTRKEQIASLEKFSEYVHAEEQIAAMKSDLESLNVYTTLSKAIRAAIAELSNGG